MSYLITSFIHEIYTYLQQPYPLIRDIFLCISASSILIALAYIWRSFTTNDQSFKEKFKKKYSSIKVNVTPINCIFFKIDETDFSIHLKNGKELTDRNKCLYEITKDLIAYNDNSINAIYFSILCFIIFFSVAKQSILAFFGIGFITIISLYLILKFENYQKNKKKIVIKFVSLKKILILPKPPPPRLLCSRCFNCFFVCIFGFSHRLEGTSYFYTLFITYYFQTVLKCLCD